MATSGSDKVNPNMFISQKEAASIVPLLCAPFHNVVENYNIVIVEGGSAWKNAQLMTIVLDLNLLFLYATSNAFNIHVLTSEMGDANALISSGKRIEKPYIWGKKLTKLFGEYPLRDNPIVENISILNASTEMQKVLAGLKEDELEKIVITPISSRRPPIGFYRLIDLLRENTSFGINELLDRAFIVLTNIFKH